MNPSNLDVFLRSVFSDETEMFRQPAEPGLGDSVTVQIRVGKGSDVRIWMLVDFPAVPMPMALRGSDAFFDWYEVCIPHLAASLFYIFRIEYEGKTIVYNRMGAWCTDAMPAPDPSSSFRIYPGFHVPDWARGAVQYQILPDRFCNGNPDTDVRNREYYYSGGYIHHSLSWKALPGVEDYRCMYGGDLRGVLDKLDYLQSLGVEVLYFNPIFVSPSGHGYDTQDYDYIDPHLTVIPKDEGRVLEEGVRDNSQASLYRCRTTDPVNLQASNEWFAAFCREVHRRGMRIILDGVFNHCGSFHYWMDREGLYPDRKGAWQCASSPYRSYFTFQPNGHYDSWWNVETLPKLNYEQSNELCQEIFRIAEKWVSPPYSVDGWRLDVAADLGKTRIFNHLFWKEFRRRVKAANPDALIIAEHYGNPEEWLNGEEWDSVMNYDAFMEPVTFFLTGLEKHSDYRRDDLHQNGEAFFRMIFEGMARMPKPSVDCAMDELSNHDHSRFMTRTNGKTGRLADMGSAAAGEGIRPEVFREAAVIQMTWPGAPTIYYGDEAGLVGWTDPDNRRTYPWGHEDKQLLRMFRELARIREKLPVLRRGSVKALCAGHGFIAYARFDRKQKVVVALNNLDEERTLQLPLASLGVGDGTDMLRLFMTSRAGADSSRVCAGTVENGMLVLPMQPRSSVILTEEIPE